MPVLLYLLLLVGIACNATAREDTEGRVFYSPGGVYSVATVWPKAADGRRDDDKYTLVVARKGHPISESREMGAITEVYWSPDGRYVAVNYHNANSGDYTYVFSLPDGAVIKKPFDNLPMKDEAKWYPEYAGYEEYKGWIFSRGWNKQNQLRIRRISFYKDIKDYLCDDLTYAVQNGRLQLVTQTVTKKPRGG